MLELTSRESAGRIGNRYGTSRRLLADFDVQRYRTCIQHFNFNSDNYIQAKLAHTYL